MTKEITFDQACRQYLQSNPTGCRKELERIVPYIGHIPITQLNQVRVNELIREMTKGKPLKGSSINRSYITPIVAVMRYAADTSLTDGLLPRIKRRPEVFVVAKVPPEEHIGRLLQRLPYPMACMLALMTATGLRTGEAYRIKREDIRDGVITIWKTKNGRPKQIVVPDGWEYPEEGWNFSKAQFWRVVRETQRSALDGMVHRPHELGRHAFAARFLKAGNDIKRLQEAGGWETLAVPAKIYGHISKSETHNEVRRLARNLVLPSRKPDITRNNETTSVYGSFQPLEKTQQKKGPGFTRGPSLGRKRP
jgi:site-specific recombinase XerD